MTPVALVISMPPEADTSEYADYPGPIYLDPPAPTYHLIDLEDIEDLETESSAHVKKGEVLDSINGREWFEVLAYWRKNHQAGCEVLQLLVELNWHSKYPDFVGDEPFGIPDGVLITKVVTTRINFESVEFDPSGWDECKLGL